MIRQRLARAYGLATLTIAAGGELARYPARGEAGPKSWEMLLRLHCATNGWSTGIARRALQWMKPPPRAIPAFDSLLGHYDASTLEAAAQAVRRDGYYVFPTRLPDAICDDIVEHARTSDGWGWRNGAHLEPVASFDPGHAVAHRYEFAEEKIWGIPAYQELIADPIFVNLSQAYFGGASALKEVSLWCSPAIADGKPDDDAAQIFHFDYDAAPIWLKYFVYLSDVTEENGPHVFVKGSHCLGQKRARALLARGYTRISDADIAAVFGAENLVEITGLKGTIFVADTMGFHKGKPPQRGHRSIAQLEYAMPLFVPARSRPLPLPTNATPKLLATFGAYPWAFTRFQAPR